MGTLNAIYVRGTGSDIVDALKAKFRKPVTEPGSDFVWIQQPDSAFGVPEKDLAALSKKLNTDVLWLSYQSVSESFEYHHWATGKLVRALAYQITQEGWERVDGEAEDWEAAAFDGEEPEADGPSPFIDARETARAVAEHYVLPGWGVKPAKAAQAKTPKAAPRKGPARGKKR